VSFLFQLLKSPFDPIFNGKSRGVILSAGLLLATCLTGCVTSVTERVIPIKDKAEASPQSENYKLLPSDSVKVTVFQEPDLVTEEQIARDGGISFPLIGRVVIGGLTVDGAQSLIEHKLSEKYLKDPQVSVVITGYSAQNFTILGQVGAPGSYPIPPDEVAFTLPMAIARAGGNTRIGNLRNISITRRTEDSISQFTVNMLSAEGQQFVIKRGDLINVQETLF
jgi:polysaccharide export outer membrane protein